METSTSALAAESAARPGAVGPAAARLPVTCGSDTDCRLSVLHCDVSGSRTCVGCTGDAHCAGTGSPRCDLTIHRCVTCLAATDCAAGETCGGGRCVTTCREDTTPSTCISPLSCQNSICASCGDDAVCPAGSPTPFCLAPAGDLRRLPHRRRLFRRVAALRSGEARLRGVRVRGRLPGGRAAVRSAQQHVHRRLIHASPSSSRSGGVA